MPPLTTEELDALGLTPEQLERVRALNEENVQLSDNNNTLAQRTREQDADARVDELKTIGFSDRPGALAIYRRVFLADDGEPAVVALSDTGQQVPMRAVEILDLFIDAIKGPDTKVAFSAQHTASGNDNRPPALVDDERNKRPLEDRVKDMKAALGRA
jgi:hypothetical protein